MDRNTTTTDCISRIDAIKVVIEALKEYMGDGVIKCTDGLRSLPPVTPKERKGEWITAGHTNHINGTLWAACSVCGSPGDLWDNYCRACGARMKGSDD